MKVYSSKKLANKKGFYAPTQIPNYHTNKNCKGFKRIDPKHLFDAKESVLIGLGHKKCPFCKELDAQTTAPSVQEFKEFIAPLVAPTNTTLVIPCNMTETLTLNGVKYIRADKVEPKPLAKGLLVMEDGTEFIVYAG